MATHSSVLAWRIPGTGEPGGLPSLGSHRVGHNWSDSAAAAAVYILPYAIFTLLYRSIHTCKSIHTHIVVFWAGNQIAFHILDYLKVMKSQTRLSDFTFTFHFPTLEKGLVTHSSVLAWRIPRTGESGGLSSMGSHRVGHNWSDLAAAAAVLINDLKILGRIKRTATHVQIYDFHDYK